MLIFGHIGITLDIAFISKYSSSFFWVYVIGNQ